MQEVNTALVDVGAYMAAHGLSQTRMAKAAAVSQATVSRALRGVPERTGRARSRLFIYIHEEMRRSGTVHGPKEQVLQAFDRIWGTSDAHASAMAKVIEALDGLRPVAQEGKISV
jgi:predicted transcriptional regulator